MKPISFGPDGANAIRRAYHRSRVRRLLRVNWTHRGLRPNDVMVASYPRSGNLWLRFMLVELLLGDASVELVRSSAPYVGSHDRGPAFLPSGGRLVKTHEPYLATYRRAIHLVRDPRDVVLSYFRFLEWNKKLVIPRRFDRQLAFERFVDAFIRGLLDAHGTWKSHLTSWTAARFNGRADVMQIRFEEMRAQPAAVVGRISSWLGAAVSEAEIARAVERSAIDLMRGATAPNVRPSPNVGPLVDQGRVGGWRDILTERQIQKFDAFADGLQLMGYPTR